METLRISATNINSYQHVWLQALIYKQTYTCFYRLFEYSLSLVYLLHLNIPLLSHDPISTSLSQRYVQLIEELATFMSYYLPLESLLIE